MNLSRIFAAFGIIITGAIIFYSNIVKNWTDIARSLPISESWETQDSHQSSQSFENAPFFLWIFWTFLNIFMNFEVFHQFWNFCWILKFLINFEHCNQFWIFWNILSILQFSSILKFFINFDILVIFWNLDVVFAFWKFKKLFFF